MHDFLRKKAFYHHDSQRIRQMTFQSDRELFYFIVKGCIFDLCDFPKPSDKDIEGWVDEWMDKHHVDKVFGIDSITVQVQDDSISIQDDGK